METRFANAERSHDLKVSAGILSDYLIHAGYKLVKPFATNLPCLRGVVPYSNNASEQVSTLLVASTSFQKLPQENGSSPFLLFLEYNEQAPSQHIQQLEQTRSKMAIVQATTPCQSIDTLIADIQGCFLSLNEYAYKSALALSAPKPLQALVDIAEKEFNLFISIVDNNYLLLAHTRNIKPLDTISKSLVELGYHTDEILASERGNNYLSEEIKQQTGVKEYPAKEKQHTCSYLTAPLYVQQKYLGLVAMTSPQDSFTPGQRDLFEMFAGFCSMVLKRKWGLSATQGDPDQTFLQHLITTEGLDASYIRRQMTLLNIPVQGSYMLVLMEVPGNISSQVGFILNEIRGIKDVYALPVLYNNAIVVLLNSAAETLLAKAVEALVESKMGEYLERVFESEVFDDFRSINIAYRSLLSAKNYARLTATPIWEETKEVRKIIPFAEVFTFAMIDPDGNSDVKYFAASNTVIERILRSDAEKGTNDFELLAAYLSKGDKASRVADLFHLHRNGVAYRIERIQNQFGIDLNDPTIRNYVQMAIFCKITTDPECARKILEA